jgi:hypothetical protein
MNDRIRLLYESVLNEGYDTSLEREYTIETSLDGIRELAESIGIDTSIIRVEYIAEQLGFVGLLNESTGEMVYILEKFDLNNVLNKIKQGFGKVDEFAADKIRKFVANNLSHSYMQNKAAKEINKNYLSKHQNKIMRINNVEAKFNKRLRDPNFKPDWEKYSKVQDYKADERMELFDKELYLKLNDKKPLEKIIRKKGKHEDNIKYKIRTLTSGLLPSEKFSDEIKKSKNAFRIDPNTGEKIDMGDKGILGYHTAYGELHDKPAGQEIFIRNIDKPYDTEPDKMGRKDSLKRLSTDIKKLTRTYPHELRHAEDMNIRGAERYAEEGIDDKTDYFNDPRERRARETEKDVSKKMKYSWIPALAKGVGENIYKRVTGRGTGSGGDSTDDTFINTLKKEDPNEYEKVMKK